MTPLHYAVCNGHYHAVGLLLDYGADIVDPRDLVSTACLHGYVDIVDKLAHHGAMINHADHCGNVYISITKRDMPMIKALIKGFGDISTHGLGSYTNAECYAIMSTSDLISHACTINDIDLIRCLIEAGMKLLFCRSKYIRIAREHDNHEIVDMIASIH